MNPLSQTYEARTEEGTHVHMYDKSTCLLMQIATKTSALLFLEKGPTSPKNRQGEI